MPAEPQREYAGTVPSREDRSGESRNTDSSVADRLRNVCAEPGQVGGEQLTMLGRGDDQEAVTRPQSRPQIESGGVEKNPAGGLTYLHEVRRRLRALP